ncbi:glycosyltransferase family 2 protein [Acidobacteriota bacterium]
MGEPFISIVTPTYNRKDLLLRHLKALEKQTLPPNEFEVVVIDDGSTDGTDEFLRSYRPQFRFSFHHQENSGLASSRNAGIRLAAGQVVLLLDDDVMPSPELVREHIKPHRQSDDVVVIGSLPYPDDLPQDTFLWYLERIGHFDLYSRKDKYEAGRPPLQPLNGNSSVRKEHLLRTGLYDERFQQYGGEDVEFGFRLEKAGLKWIYAPTARGFHYHTKNFDDYINDQHRSGKAIAGIFRKHPEIKRARKIDIVTDPLYKINWRRMPQAVFSRLAHNCPLTVRIARRLALWFGRFFALRGVVYLLYKYVGYAAYASGIREELELTL